ncbi:hypothetical protein MKP07_31050 [Niabella hibiscisoli]|nr:helix-turn-helix domain-containing protein [Niabella hibiscisoli]MCH5720347.1 hypothetical protein [Niabella hibiscisoli]
MNELKKMFLEVLQNPSIAEQNPSFINDLKDLKTSPDSFQQISSPLHIELPSALPVPNQQAMPIHIGMANSIHDHEEVEESLNIMDKEKELIIKALKKHKSKRKDAALDLGISERTLYRKLKEYDIEEL